MTLQPIDKEEYDTKIDKYVIFTRKDFEEVLSDIGDFEKIEKYEFDKFGIDKDTKEVIYILKIKNENRYILIYSSIQNDVDRPCGKDAIRVCPVIGRDSDTETYIYSKRGRINRTENWRKTLKERINM